MATAEQLKALIDSFRTGDEARFRSVTLQIAARSAKQGKGKLADELRAMVEKTARQNSGPVVPIARPPKALEGLLQSSYPEIRLAEMVLSSTARQELEKVVVEYRQRDRLRAHGLRPRQRLLLVGPPGCGKTMTASALAGECHLPLMTVQLHSLITRYLGETAAQLHLVFESIERVPAVYLFDEFDALGAVRSSHNDVGEIRRVLNSFLQFLENTRSNSIVVAATNLVEMLDDALLRRFDLVLPYETPDEAMVKALLNDKLRKFGFSELSASAWKRLTQIAVGLSHAEIVRAAEEAAKDAVLNDRNHIDPEALERELAARERFRGHFRVQR